MHLIKSWEWALVTVTYHNGTVVLFKIARPKDRYFLPLGMMAGTKDHEYSVAVTLLSIPEYPERGTKDRDREGGRETRDL